MHEKFFDSHCHLTDPRFGEDLDDVVRRAHSAGVSRMLIIGTDPDTSRHAIELVERYDDCYSTIGVAPHEAGKVSIEQADEVMLLANRPKVIAIGEIGLEYHYDFAPRDAQRDLLRYQLRYARELNLPVIFHHREAESDFKSIVEEAGLPEAGAVMHCFTGGQDMLDWAVGMGMYISYSGIITFRATAELRDLAKQTPLERLMVETDAPYLAPEPVRGKRCEPAMVVETARVLASETALSVDDIARITRCNAMRLFRIPSAESPKIAYPIRRSLYLNITNRCSNHCTFCIRHKLCGVKGHQLILDSEPELAEVMAAIHEYNIEDYEEVVFCGYGEPTYRMNLLLEIAARLKSEGKRVRLNTNGQGNLINHGNIVPDLCGVINAVSVSLNSADAQQYQSICRSDYGEDAWNSVVMFAQLCHSAGMETQLSVVELPEVDIAACEQLPGR